MATYYVSSASGSDNNLGTSANSSFATLQQAADRTQPGDTVQVMNGTYTAPSSFDVLDIRTSGTASAPIVFEAAPGQHPVIDSSGNTAGIAVEGASYIDIKGFEIRGDAASIDQAFALAHGGQPSTGGQGISVWSSMGQTPTHVTIENNHVHDQPGAGIWAGWGDYISILNNVTDHNAFWSNSADSGISVGWMKSTDANTGYKTIVSGNTSFDNKENIPWSATGTITDGNGILVDTDRQNGYNGRTLVSNNLTYGNGGTGAGAVFSDNVDFLYNTSYGNNQSPGLQEGQITSQGSAGNRIENNILVASPGGAVNENDGGVIYDYNLYYGGAVAMKGAHDVVADPAFVSPGAGNFALQAGSAAIGIANPAFTMPADITGSPRPTGSAYDVGAYEHQGGTISQGGTGSPPPTTTDTLQVSLSEDAWQGDAQAFITVDGKTIGGVLTVTALHSQGKSQTVTLAGHWAPGAHDVGVQFINDAYGGTATTDRNLYVNKVTLDGQASAAPPATLYSNGTAHFATAASASPLMLQLSEDAYQGDAQFTVSVDGKTLGAAQAVTALHSQGAVQSFAFGQSMAAGTHDVAVSFLNDAWGGTAATDRNLYVNAIDVNGAAVGGTATLLTTSTHHFAVVVAAHL